MSLNLLIINCLKLSLLLNYRSVNRKQKKKKKERDYLAQDIEINNLKKKKDNNNNNICCILIADNLTTNQLGLNNIIQYIYSLLNTSLLRKKK